MSTLLQEVKVGQLVMLECKEWLVVRICQSTALFENDNQGGLLLHEETYAQLHDKEGMVEFITISERTTPVEKKAQIKALPVFDRQMELRR